MIAGRQSLLLAVAFLSGGCVMVLEFAAARLFAPWFGVSLPVWSNVIGLVLAALAAGSWLGGRLAAGGAGFRTPGWILLAAGALSVASAHLGSGLARALLPSGADLEGVVSLLVQGSLVATLVVFGPPMVLLGTVVPLAVHLVAPGRDPGKAAGWVVGLSTAGSIAGTFLTAHWLLDAWGTRATILAAGAVLLLCGAALVATAGRRAAAAAVAAALAAAVPAAAAPLGPFRPATGDAEVLAEYDDAYQFLQVRRVVEEDPSGREVPTTLLTMNEGVNTYHSVLREGSHLTGGRYYDLYPALPLLTRAEEGGRLEVAILGLAAGTQARALRHFHGSRYDLRVVGVEIDPAAVEAGHRHFELPRDAPWLEVRTLDARTWANLAPEDRKFDLILVDAFSQEYYVPFHMATEEFFRACRDRLKPGGVLAFNAFAYRPDDPLLKGLVNTTAAAFGRAWTAPVPYYPNWVVLAAAGGRTLPLLDFAGRASADGFPALRAVAEGPEVLTLAGRAFARARVHPFDPEGPVFTDDHAPVEALVDRGQAAEERARIGR